LSLLVRIAWLALAGFAAACSRTALDADAAGEDGAAPACSSTATSAVGAPTRFASAAQIPYGGAVLDPDDDLLLVVGGLSSSGEAAQAVSAVRLGTGESLPLARAGDARVDLGPSLRAVWDPTSHRVLALGGSLWNVVPNPPDDTSQVFALTVSGSSAELALLPNFPDGETADVPLAQPALAGVQFVSLTYDATRRRMIALGTDFSSDDASVWALSLDAPSGWTKLDGTLPLALYDYSSILSVGFSLAWDDALCGFVTAVTDGYCVYQAWRLDFGDATFTATALGVADQPMIRYGRGDARFDAARGNFVFPSGFDCEEHDFPAASVDFLPLTVTP